MITDGRMGPAPGNKYPSEERKDLDTDIIGSRASAFPFPSLSSVEASLVLSAFPRAAGIPREAWLPVGPPPPVSQGALGRSAEAPEPFANSRGLRECAPD